MFQRPFKKQAGTAIGEECFLIQIRCGRCEGGRGYGRNADGNGYDSTMECDAGAYEFGAMPVAEEAALYMTAAGPGSTNNGINFGKEDILFWDGSAWSLAASGTWCWMVR